MAISASNMSSVIHMLHMTEIAAMMTLGSLRKQNSSFGFICYQFIIVMFCNASYFCYIFQQCVCL
jgi:hypothetical protein